MLKADAGEATMPIVIMKRASPILFLVLAGCAGSTAGLRERDQLRTEVQSLRQENAELSEHVNVLADRVGRLSAAQETPASAAGNPTAAAGPVSTETPPSNEGWITIRTEPWCDVYLNGDFIGTTPLNRLLSPTGTMPVLLVCKPPGVLRELKLTVRAGEESTTKLNLDSE